MAAPGLLFAHDDPSRDGGAEVMLQQLAAIARRSAEVHLGFLFGGQGAPPTNGFESQAAFDFPLGLGLAAAPALARNLQALRAHAAGLGVRACLAFSYPAAFRAALAFGRQRALAWMCSVPVVMDRRARPHRRALALGLIAGCGATAVCPSQGMARDLLDLGYPAAQLRVVPNTVDADRHAAAAMDTAARSAFRAAAGLPEADLVVACVARLDPVKNHPLLLRAVARARQLGGRVALVCVGGAARRDRAYARGLEETARALGVASLVRFVGHRTDVVKWLAAADAAALVSHAEAGSLALQEAAAAGLPLLASEVGGNTDVVLPGRTGFLIAPDDVEGCAAALVRLALDQGLRRRLGSEAQRHVRQSFSLPRMEAAWSEVFTNLLAAEGASA